jgi:predicted ArsR family transcriptional regulator
MTIFDSHTQHLPIGEENRQQGIVLRRRILAVIERATKPITQAEIAGTLGVSKHRIARAMTLLAQRGLVRMIPSKQVRGGGALPASYTTRSQREENAAEGR